jgi:HSP20 family protein
VEVDTAAFADISSSRTPSTIGGDGEMALRGDSLLEELDAMSEEFSRRFGLRPAPTGLRGWLPPVDVWETESELVIELDVPGCQPENISAEIVEQQLVVTGERAPRAGVSRRYRTERWQGRFVRSFVVPRELDGERIRADYHEGVLTIRLPKPEAARPRRISIGRDASVVEAGDQQGQLENATA